MRKTVTTACCWCFAAIAALLDISVTRIIPLPYLTFASGVLLTWTIFLWRKEISSFARTIRQAKARRSNPKPKASKPMPVFPYGRSLMTRYEYQTLKTVRDAMGRIFKTAEEWERESIVPDPKLDPGGDVDDETRQQREQAC